MFVASLIFERTLALRLVGSAMRKTNDVRVACYSSGQFCGTRASIDKTSARHRIGMEDYELLSSITVTTLTCRTDGTVTDFPAPPSGGACSNYLSGGLTRKRARDCGESRKSKSGRRGVPTCNRRLLVRRRTNLCAR